MNFTNTVLVRQLGQLRLQESSIAKRMFFIRDATDAAGQPTGLVSSRYEHCVLLQ
jgi:hypothetical protein